MSKTVKKIAGFAIDLVALAVAGPVGFVIADSINHAIGLGSVQGLLDKKPKSSPAQVDRLTVSLIVDTPRKIAFGRTALNTDLRYQEWWGAQQELCGQIIVLASHHIEALEEVWLNDELAWTKDAHTVGRYVDYFFCSVRERATPANAYNDTWSNRWGSSAPMTGCADSFIRFRVVGMTSGAESPFSSSIASRITFRGKGALLYDPRFDSTRGGSGTMRVDDQSTWAFSYETTEIGRNPALQLLFYLLGWRIQNPVTGVWNLAVGRGCRAEDIDFESFITAANMCDELVYKGDGSQEPRYRADGTFSEGDDPKQVYAAFEAVMNGKLRDTNGRLTLQLFHNDLAAPVLDFTEDDILGDVKWTGGNALHERKNVIKGKYTDASNNALYQSVDYPLVSIPSLDGLDRIDPVDYALCQSPDQAQRLAKMHLMRGLYAGALQASYKARAWVVKDGDPVRQRFGPLGFDYKLFRVALGTVDRTGACPITLIEENVAIYAAYSDTRAAVVAAEPNTFDPLLQPLIAAIADINERVAAIASDNVLAAGEKPQVVRDWNALYQNWYALNAKGASMGIAVGERAAASTAINALATYLTSLNPPWYDGGHNTDIVGATFQSKWSDATQAVANLQAAIQGQIGPAGPSGSNAPTPILQYSIDGSTSWHSTWASGDLYLRVSVDGGATFNTPARIVGATGAAGPSGAAAPQVSIQYSTDSSSWHGSYVSGDIYFRVSTDAGATWGGAAYFQGPTGASGPAGANAPVPIIQYSLDGSSSWHSTWASGDLYLRVSVDGGTTFGTPARIVGATGATGASAPNVAIQYSADNASWHGTYSSGDIYFRVSTDGGATWGAGAYFQGPTGSAGPAGANAPIPVVQYSVDGSSGWHAPWASGDLYLRVSVDGGVTFDVPARIVGATGAAGPAGSNAPQVRIQYSTNNSSWHDTYGAGDIYFRVSTDNGTSWGSGAYFQGPTGTAGPAGNNAPTPIFQYSVDGSTSWHSPWSSGDLYIRASVDGGATFDTPARIVGATGAAGPAGSDAPHVAIQYSADNSSWHYPYATGDIYFRISTDGGSSYGAGALFQGPPGPSGGSGAPISGLFGDVVGPFKVPAGGSFTVQSVLTFSGATPGGTMTVMNRYRLTGAGSWTDLDEHSGDFDAGTTMRKGTGIETVLNSSSTQDQLYEVQATSSGGGGSSPAGRSWTEVVI